MVTFSKLNPSQSAETGRERHRQTDSHTDRLTDKRPGRQMRRTDRHADWQAVTQRSRETKTQSDRGSDIPNVNGSFLMLPKFLFTCTRV